MVVVVVVAVATKGLGGEVAAEEEGKEVAEEAVVGVEGDRSLFSAIQK